MDIDRFRVSPGASVDLGSWPTNDDGGWGRNKAKDRTNELNDELEDLQELLYAENRHKLLVVIQATDTGGKDGTIRHVFDGVNPQGVKVASFKKPTPQELAHDYLWRVHAQTPGKGEITIFNRSHYEDVLVVRVHDLVSAARWERRYDHINAFEQMLADEGTTIVKLFLHISKDEQSNGCRPASTSPTRTGSSPSVISTNGNAGMTTRPRSRRCSREPAPRTRPGG